MGRGVGWGHVGRRGGQHSRTRARVWAARGGRGCKRGAWDNACVRHSCGGRACPRQRGHAGAVCRAVTCMHIDTGHAGAACRAVTCMHIDTAQATQGAGMPMAASDSRPATQCLSWCGPFRVASAQVSPPSARQSRFCPGDTAFCTAPHTQHTTRPTAPHTPHHTAPHTQTRHVSYPPMRAAHDNTRTSSLHAPSAGAAAPQGKVALLLLLLLLL